MAQNLARVGVDDNKHGQRHGDTRPTQLSHAPMTSRWNPSGDDSSIISAVSAVTLSCQYSLIVSWAAGQRTDKNTQKNKTRPSRPARVLCRLYATEKSNLSRQHCR